MTELIWEGKYDANGKKTAPFRYPLPFQDVETVNEPQSVRAYNLNLFPNARPTEWRNRLIWGDKKYVLPSLLPEFAGKVNLIYIDPPFATGADFSFIATIPDDPNMKGDQTARFVKQPSMIEQKAYRDTWGRGLDGYLAWFYDTSVLLNELLADNGSLYVHLDAHVAHYVKAMLDEIFGEGNFVREIIWRIGWISGYKAKAENWARNHDTIFFYTKSSKFTFNKLYLAHSEGYGRREARELLILNKESDPVAEVNDRTEGKPIDDVWVDLPSIQIMSFSGEKTGYGTQKNENLLERIIKTSSNEGDLVLDCFSGSGTTAAVAEKLGRRWIASDLGRFAIHTTRKRLLGIPNVRPFNVQNLGKYERQAWQSTEFGEGVGGVELANRQARYRRFILDLYGAEPLEGYTWLHGVKGGRMVYVGSVDAAVSPGEIRQAATEFWRVAGSSNGGGGATTNGLDVLGWDFAFGENELGKQMAAEANIDLRFKRIPREVLEKKAVQQGDIHFFELAALSIRYALEGRRLSLDLIDFIINPDDVPPDVQKAVTHWTQWVDYWAIDWDYKDDTFHNQWQHYRTKRDPKLITSAAHTYDQPGTYTVVVKVIDLLGNDTTRAITLEVK